MGSLGLAVERVLLAEGAILVQFQLVRRVLLVLHGIVVSLLALVASQSDFHAHLTAPPYYWYPSRLAGDTDCLPAWEKAPSAAAEKRKKRIQSLKKKQMNQTLPNETESTKVWLLVGEEKERALRNDFVEQDNVVCLILRIVHNEEERREAINMNRVVFDASFVI